MTVGCFDGNYGDAPSYEPNSFGEPVEDRCFKEPLLKITADVDRYDPREGSDDYTQAGNLFRLMSEKGRLFANTARAMVGVPERSTSVGLASVQGPTPNTEADWPSNWESSQTKPSQLPSITIPNRVGPWLQRTVPAAR